VYATVATGKPSDVIGRLLRLFALKRLFDARARRRTRR
jgi:hypothetical protein